MYVRISNYYRGPLGFSSPQMIVPERAVPLVLRTTSGLEDGGALAAALEMPGIGHH